MEDYIVNFSGTYQYSVNVKAENNNDALEKATHVLNMVDINEYRFRSNKPKVMKFRTIRSYFDADGNFLYSKII